MIAWATSVLLAGSLGFIYIESWFPPVALLIAAVVVNGATLSFAMVSFARFSRAPCDERPPGRWLSAATALLGLATLLLLLPIAWLYLVGPYAFCPLRLIGFF